MILALAGQQIEMLENPLVLFGIAFCLYSLLAGYALLTLIRIPTGMTKVGLAAPVGLAALAVLTTWSGALGVSPTASMALAGVLVLAGVAVVLLEQRGGWRVGSQGRFGVILLLIALALATVLMGAGFAGVDAPLSTHDGAHHVETIDAARRGLRPGGWYPTGLHTTIATVLGYVPWIDTAAGAFGASLGLSLLGLVGAFGLAHAVWRNPVVAGASALAVALTFQYPYQLHFWGGWPLAASILLVLGLWTVALDYLRRPRAQHACIAGLLAAGIVLIHGTEVYTATIIVLVLLGAGWRQVRLPQVALHTCMALALGSLLAAPYVPTLLDWAGTGGAAAVGEAQAAASAAFGETDTDNYAILAFNTFGTGVGVDLPIRLGLVLIGAMQAIKLRDGRSLLVIGGIFLGLAFMFGLLHTSLTDAVFAATFPWAQGYRLFIIVALAAGLLQGAGAIVVLKSYADVRHRSSVAQLKQIRLIHTLASTVAALVMGGSAASLGLLLLLNARAYASTSADDAAAMAWLRTHTHQGEIVANDWFADAGIWVPYKAGMPVVLPRLATDRIQERQLVLDSIAQLDTVRVSESAACALGVAYVFHGSQATAWEPRHFPPLAVLQQSPSLEEVFHSGGAAVFKTRLTCSNQGQSQVLPTAAEGERPSW